MATSRAVAAVRRAKVVEAIAAVKRATYEEAAKQAGYATRSGGVRGVLEGRERPRGRRG